MKKRIGLRSPGIRNHVNIHNFEYDYKCEPFIKYFNVRKTLTTKKGICYDFSHLFAAICRSQNIPCYVLDGTKLDDANYHHTWNRVYFNDSWWDTLALRFH